MSWSDLHLTADQRDVVDLVLPWRDSLPPVEADADAASVVAARDGAVELGIWSIGMSDAVGGGGAELDQRLLAFAALAPHSAALAWASAQAHAAVEVLGPGADADAVVAGELPVAVVGLASVGVHLSIDEADGAGGDDGGGTAHGRVDRVDPGGPDPAVVLLGSGDQAWFVPSASVSAAGVRARTGLAGAATTALTVDGPVRRLGAAPLAAVRCRLHLAAAAIAAGLGLDSAARAAEYAASRVQFGAPIDELPTVRRSLVDQRVLVADSVATLLGAPGDDPWTGASIHAQTLERALEVCTASLQVHGGYGYLVEYRVERLLRDVVSLRAATASLDATAGDRPLRSA